MRLNKFVSVALLALLLLGLIANILQINFNVKEVHALPQNSSTYMTLFLNLRPVIHTWFNRTDVTLTFPRNFTVIGGTMLKRRWDLGTYALLCTFAYEKTNNITYLVEAKYLVDTLEQQCMYETTKSIFINGANSKHGWFYLDVSVWWAMQKLNEYGYGDYDVTGYIDNSITYAAWDNSTDLAWNYDWDNPAPATLTVNTWSRLLAFMGYLTKNNVKDYSDEISRIYHSTDRARLGDNFYTYTIGQASPQYHYTLVTLWGLLATYYYEPTVFNQTKIQQTLDACNATNYGEDSSWSFASLDILAQNLDDFDESLDMKRSMNNTIYYTSDVSKNKNHWGTLTVEYDRKNIHEMQQGILWALGITTDFATPNVPNADTMLDSGTKLDSPFIQHASPASTYPYLDWKVGAGAGYTSSSGISVKFTDNYIYPSYTASFNGSYYNINGSAKNGGGQLIMNASRNFRSQDVYLGATNNQIMKLDIDDDPYTVQILCSNGTLTPILDDIPNDTVYQLTQHFAILRFNPSPHDVAGFLVKCSNHTWYIDNDAGGYVRVKTQSTNLRVHTVQYGADNSTTFLAWVQEQLSYWQTNDITYMEYSTSETEYEKTFYKVPAQDLILWSYNITGLFSSVSYSANILTVSISEDSGTSTTKIYCGSEGEPKTVTGALSYDYEFSTKILTLTIAHSSSQEVTLDWSSEGTASGLFNLVVSILKDGYPAQAVINLQGENRSIYGLTNYQLPYGTYTIIVYCDGTVQTKQIGMFANNNVGFDFESAREPLDLKWLAVPITIILAVALFTLLRRRR